MPIYPIVEGSGEITAVPVLLRRLRDASEIYTIDIGKPIQRKRSELVQEASLRRAVALALLKPACEAVLILFDADNDCPKALAPKLCQWAQAEARTIPCAVVLANREYEAWFLASLESLRGHRGIRADAQSFIDPESRRGAKEQLRSHMAPGKSYQETTDQAAMSQLFDMRLTFSRSRSFRGLVKAFGELTSAMGHRLDQWPPMNWKP
ncbi:MAG TPA: DUF4276 family protein [Pirellulales bacterium]|nr:DUF4276 family protein [Pirellulales bacterium]